MVVVVNKGSAFIFELKKVVVSICHVSRQTHGSKFPNLALPLPKFWVMFKFPGNVTLHHGQYKTLLVSTVVYLNAKRDQSKRGLGGVRGLLYSDVWIRSATASNVADGTGAFFLTTSFLGLHIHLRVLFISSCHRRLRRVQETNITTTSQDLSCDTFKVGHLHHCA